MVARVYVQVDVPYSKQREEKQLDKSAQRGREAPLSRSQLLSRSIVSRVLSTICLAWVVLRVPKGCIYVWVYVDVGSNPHTHTHT